MVLPFPSRFCMLFKDLSCAPSSALQNGIIFWLWLLPPFLHCWTAAKLTIPIHSIQHTEGLLLLCQQLCFHLQLFTHPLRSLHRLDALTVQGHMWLLYQHRSILLLYLVSKQDRFGDHRCPVKYWFSCCSNWSGDFSFPNISVELAFRAASDLGDLPGLSLSSEEWCDINDQKGSVPFWKRINVFQLKARSYLNRFSWVSTLLYWKPAVIQKESICANIWHV